ncbi:hypothetical protein F2P79_012527 [Pimephales promelas]|nr:hypothetical protein F2P79_012527 [Pimephales promelas]
MVFATIFENPGLGKLFACCPNRIFVLGPISLIPLGGSNPSSQVEQSRVIDAYFRQRRRNNKLSSLQVLSEVKLFIRIQLLPWSKVHCLHV